MANTTATTDRIDRFAAHGTGRLPRRIRLADGTEISVHAASGAYCTPRPGRGDVPEGYAGPYSELEVYLFGADTVPGWERYADGDLSDEDRDGVVYGYVPVEQVRALVLARGGEHAEQDEQDDAARAEAEARFAQWQATQSP